MFLAEQLFPAIATNTTQSSDAPVKRGWRDILPIHPAADLLPLMDEAG